jgi:acetyltransferase-like isoleucine patch superfamily enzyme
MSLDKIKNMLKRIIEDPGEVLSYAMGLMRGLGYLLYYGIFKNNVKIGFPFIVNAKVRIIGPGTVTIGKGCMVMKNAFKGLTIITYSRDATVKIGNKCLLGGTTIRCHGTITIGDRAMTAISLIQDSFLVSQDRTNGGAVPPLPRQQNIVIGNNVWLGEASFVMKGSTIGDDCVLSSGSWCHDAVYQDYVLIMGSPVRSAIPIDKLLRLKGEL